MSTHSHLSALTAAYFGLGQSKQSRSLPSYGPYAALRGPFAPASSGPARPPTCCASLHLAPSAAPKGAAHQGPPDACAQPPEVAKLGAAPGLALAVASGIMGSLDCNRWQASSHRFERNFQTFAVPVGAGLPAIGPNQTTHQQQSNLDRNITALDLLLICS